jgi:hypothetical protein
MNDLQAVVTGMIVGALMSRHLAIDVQPTFDDEGNYLPELVIVGRESGTRLRIRVELEDGE